MTSQDYKQKSLEYMNQYLATWEVLQEDDFSEEGTYERLKGELSRYEGLFLNATLEAAKQSGQDTTDLEDIIACPNKRYRYMSLIVDRFLRGI